MAAKIGGGSDLRVLGVSRCQEGVGHLRARREGRDFVEGNLSLRQMFGDSLFPPIGVHLIGLRGQHATIDRRLRVGVVQARCKSCI